MRGKGNVFIVYWDRNPSSSVTELYFQHTFLKAFAIFKPPIQVFHLLTVNVKAHSKKKKQNNKTPNKHHILTKSSRWSNRRGCSISQERDCSHCISKLCPWHNNLSDFQMHGHFIPPRTKLLAEWMLHLQRWCSFHSVRAVYICLIKNNNQLKERTFPFGSATLKLQDF